MPNTQINSNAKPIFVIGSARSGTSIIAAAIKLATDISGCNEGHFLPLISFLMQEIKSYYSKKEFLMDKKGFMISHTNSNDIEEGILEIFRNICNSFYKQEIWIDKTPDMGMIKATPYLFRIWPKSRFIFAKRRGIECINSRLKKFPQVPFKTHCHIWKTCMESWLSVREDLNNNYIEIEQREISLNSEFIAQKIAKFLNLNHEHTKNLNYTFSNKRPEFLGGQENIQATNIEEIGWSKQYITIFRDICGSINEKMGYSETSSYYLNITNSNSLLDENKALKSAIHACEQRIGIDPNNIQNYIDFAEVLSQRKQLHKATEYIMEALVREPGLNSTYTNLFSVLQQQGNTDPEIRNCVNNPHKMTIPKTLVRKFCQFKEQDLLENLNSNPYLTYLEIEAHLKLQLSPIKSDYSTDHVAEAKKLTIPKAFVMKLPNGRAWADGVNTAVITSNNQLVTIASSRNSELAFCASSRKTPLEIDGTVAFFPSKASFGQRHCNFYHWMFNEIVRFDLLFRSGIATDKIDKFVFHRLLQLPFQQETLKILGIPNSKILETTFYPYIKAKNLIVPSPTSEPFPSKWACNFLRNKFLPRVSKVDQLKYIYISRKKASKRNVINEEELVTFLEGCGFQTVILESLSFLEQVALFSQAKVVIAPHGAGLTNVVFCNPGTKVVEIIPASIELVLYQLISYHCDLEYYSIVGDEPDDSSKLPSNRRNIIVNLSKLCSIMKLAEII